MLCFMSKKNIAIAGKEVRVRYKDENSESIVSFHKFLLVSQGLGSYCSCFG